MHETMVTDPSMMADMMKKNLTGMVPQVGGEGLWVGLGLDPSLGLGLGCNADAASGTHTAPFLQHQQSHNPKPKVHTAASTPHPPPPNPQTDTPPHPQILMGTLVTFFFSGFVMGKVPFGLSPRFRPMLQRGVDLASLDVAYFTGLSYYILLMFSSRGPFSLVFREDTVDESEVMRRQMTMGMTPGAGFDAAGVFKSEKAAWEATTHEWGLDGAEGEALAVLRKRAGSGGAAAA